MIGIIKNGMLALFAITSVLISCQPEQDNTKGTDNLTEVEERKTLDAEQQELKAIVEKFLVAAGNGDLQTMDDMIEEKGNLGIALYRDGIWSHSLIRFDEYFETAKNKERSPFYEPVNEYKILVNKGQFAFVWADATLYKFGVPRTNNIDNFTLIKEDGEWKFINISFTNTRLPEELQTFDLEVFAKSYAQVWCSQRPHFVSSFFAEDGELTINDGNTAKGRDAITNVAKGFMDAFPDMIVSMDSLITKEDKTRFYWTLTGTNTGTNGTGNKVKINGFEEWTLNEDGLIQASIGYFDAAEYKRQLEAGLEI